jgi:hypothetical protein
MGGAFLRIPKSILIGYHSVRSKVNEAITQLSRFTDPESNRLDLSQTKGWEVGVNKWERVAA